MGMGVGNPHVLRGNISSLKLRCIIEESRSATVTHTRRAVLAEPINNNASIFIRRVGDNVNPMKVSVLGCSGGIARGLRTTSILIDNDLLIDAGDGVGTLTMAEIDGIRSIFLTHSHLDHICHLPLLVDNQFEKLRDQGETLTVYGLEQTLATLRQNIFNDCVWPDFSRLPDPENPVLAFQPIQAGSKMAVGSREIEVIAAAHIVPAVSYRVQEGDASFAFSGDTGPNDQFWDALNAHRNLEMLIVEAAFPNRMKDLSTLAKHYCPETLEADLRKLVHRPDIYISHLKPGCEETVIEELKVACPDRSITRLFGGEVFDL